MSSLFILIPLSLVLLGFAVWGLLWAIERRQFEDLDTPPWRVVLDDDKAPRADGATVSRDADPRRSSLQPGERPSPPEGRDGRR